MSLKGKVIVVTGGGSGIGAAAALHFASEAAHVVISGRRLDALKAVAAKNKSIVAVQGDATDEADLERLKQETLKAFGRIDGVFLNAGYEGAGKTLAETSAAELAQVFVVNNVGPILGAVLDKSIKPFTLVSKAKPKRTLDTTLFLLPAGPAHALSLALSPSSSSATTCATASASLSSTSITSASN
jgi:NAD(P)-dependent dehydrogenase (short-subunit alcohol dehydrogenase family)